MKMNIITNLTHNNGNWKDRVKMIQIILQKLNMMAHATIVTLFLVQTSVGLDGKQPQ
jgi:hypothetical protein